VSRRNTPRSTSCSKSPRTGGLRLNHIVGDITTVRALPSRFRRDGDCFGSSRGRLWTRDQRRSISLFIRPSAPQPDRRPKRGGLADNWPLLPQSKERWQRRRMSTGQVAKYRTREKTSNE